MSRPHLDDLIRNPFGENANNHRVSITHECPLLLSRTVQTAPVVDCPAPTSLQPRRRGAGIGRTKLTILGCLDYRLANEIEMVQRRAKLKATRCVW